MDSPLRRRRIGLSFTSLVLSAIALLSTFVDVSATNATSAPAVLFVPLMLARANSTSTLYVVGSVSCSKLPCLRLYRTHDAVESAIDPTPTFTPVTMPPVGWMAQRATGSLMGLVFATPLIGYALEGSAQPQVLYATFNGAKTWQKVKIPSGDIIVGLTATGDHLYALFENCKKSNNGCVSFRVEHSTLSAQKWSGVNIPSSALNAGYSAGAIGAFGENVFISEQTNGAALLFVSHNGGVSFTKSTPSKLMSMQGCALTAVSTKELWAECPTGMLVSFLFSNDSGRTWSSLVHHQFGGTSGGFFATAGYDFAYLDVGPNPRNIYRINVGARREHTIGELACPSVISAVFMSVEHGLRDLLHQWHHNATGTNDRRWRHVASSLDDVT